MKDYYYKEKFQGDRVRKNPIKLKGEIETFEIHASHLSHCIRKSAYYLLCNERGIKIPFDQKSVNNMEWGRALHLLYQNEIDKELSKLKDDRFGWYPWFDDRWKGAMVDEWDFIERFGCRTYKDIIKVMGTFDQEMMDSKGIFIQELKSTGGMKWINEPRKNHEIQLHVYMWLREENVNAIDIWAENEKRFGDETGRWHEVAYKPVRRGRIKYIDRYNPLKTKVYDIEFNQEHMDFILEQLNKYFEFVSYFDIMIEMNDFKFPEPNYDYLARWECNPEYCPFSVKEGCPLDAPCECSQWKKK